MVEKEHVPGWAGMLSPHVKGKEGRLGMEWYPLNSFYFLNVI